MKKLLIILFLITYSNAVECFDSDEWKNIPSSFLSKIGFTEFDVVHVRDYCEEAYEAYIKYNNRNVKYEDKDDIDDKDDKGGIGDGLAGLFGGGGGGISTKAKGNIITPSARDIDMGAGGGSRSAADIMKVVRQRTPGLRHIYNKFLKKKPGFQGKVFLKFTIAPSGEVINILIASSTTDYREFDTAIKNAVGNWTFIKVKSGNTTVTIPFTFSE